MWFKKKPTVLYAYGVEVILILASVVSSNANVQSEVWMTIRILLLETHHTYST
jgi:hypothetical protein